MRNFYCKGVHANYDVAEPPVGRIGLVLGMRATRN